MYKHDNRSNSGDLGDSSVFTFISLDSSPMLSHSPAPHPLSSILLPSLTKISPLSSSSSSSSTTSPSTSTSCSTSVCPAAEYKVAYCYENGIGMEESNEEEAIKWYERASNSGYLPASYHLGLYYTKKGDEEGILKSFEYFQFSALKGYAPSQTILASCYEEGKKLPQNTNLAFSLYYKAAKQGYPLAQYRLARCYEKNIGIPDIKSPPSTLSVSFRSSSRSLSSYLRDMDDLSEIPDLQSVNLSRRSGTGTGGSGSKRREKEERNSPYRSSRSQSRSQSQSEDEENFGLSTSEYFFSLNGEDGIEGRIDEDGEDDDDNISEASHNSYLQKPTKRIPEMLKWYKKASQNGCLDATKALIRLTH
jgi:hypothetical protein